MHHARSGLARSGLARSGLARSGLARSGLALLPRHLFLTVLLLSLAPLPGCGGGTSEVKPPPVPTPRSVRHFDFQDETGPVADGFTRVTPSDAYRPEVGHGFTSPPTQGRNGVGHTWTIFGRTYGVDEVIPPAVLSDATVDCVFAGRRPLVFQADLEPGTYDVTVWLGDVTTPRHQVRADFGEVLVDVERMDINNRRGSFDQAVYGNAVPRTVRVDVPDGVLRLEVGVSPGGNRPITWTYEQDEDPKNPPETKTATLVPAYSGAAVQALTIHPAAEPPLVLLGDTLARAGAPPSPALDVALARFNAGDLAGAREAFEALTDPALRSTQASGLFHVAGHPATFEGEPALLTTADALLRTHLATAPQDHAAGDLLLQVTIAREAERQRSLYGYAAAGAPATDNLGRSCSLVENLPAGHPYHLKGEILWLRNRGGLDPRRVTVSWERAQWKARQLEDAWGAVNPHVHLYATDEWTNDGHPWTIVDWAAVAGAGPDWARSLMSNLNGWLDLFEWWSIHRQAPEGDIGGGWTDDVEIVPAFGLMSYVLEDASDITRHAVVRFADGIWNSTTIDQARGFQAQYGDVEHTAEATGNILHLYPLVRFGDPEGIERMMKSARTFADLFLEPAPGGPLGHRHFRGNHMSATQIAINPDHRADIPLCGRVTAPFAFLLWYADNPGIEGPLGDWIGAWADDAARTEYGKPAGVFPQAIWTPDDTVGYPGTGDWWSKNVGYGQYSAFPGYQFYLYNLAGSFYLRTGEPRFRAPFDAVQDLAQAWVDAGRPPAGARPPNGQEDVWCGALLPAAARRAVVNLRAASGRADWDRFLAAHANPYGRFRLDPTDAAPIEDLATVAEPLHDRWPYRTTEGVMTDRILVPGWADVISYYLGADVFSVFFGMPVHAVTWANTPRLFAAAVTETGPTRVGATLYLFTDEAREVTARFWQLERGAGYRLETGPSAGLGLDPTSIAQSVAFRYGQLGDGATFTLPGRTVTAIRVLQTSPPPATPPPLLPDPAVAARDVTYDADAGVLTIRVHNVGAASLPARTVTAYAGLDATGPEIGAALVPAIEAPTDLVPRTATVTLSYDAPTLPTAVTVVLDAPAAQITDRNDVATAWIGGPAPDLPPPMLTGFSEGEVEAGHSVTLAGIHLQAGAVARAGEAATTLFTLTGVTPTGATLVVDASAPSGVHLISVDNPDGQRSNLLPLTIAP